MKKLNVGVLGATGAVGQNYVLLLENHSWFNVSYVAASPKSAGKKYSEAVSRKWFMDKDIPKNIADLVVGDANKVEDAFGKCDFVFSAVELEKELIKEVENAYAKAGIPVVSNNSTHRWTEDVPMIIPEINHEHLQIIPEQKKHYGWEKGFIVVKPNCSIQSFLTPLHALKIKGYNFRKIIVTTEQASSGAGYPGVPSLDLIDNVIPYINGEAEKTEKEPMKIFGKIENGKIKIAEDLKISATCTRVPVINGHLASVSVEFDDKKPELEAIIEIWNEFKALPQELDLPFAPKKPIIYRKEENRPQPRKDRDNDKGMAVTVGRLRECAVLDVKFVGLSHNTIRGAAGGAILTAELLYTQGYFD